MERLELVKPFLETRVVLSLYDPLSCVALGIPANYRDLFREDRALLVAVRFPKVGRLITRDDILYNREDLI